MNKNESDLKERKLMQRRKLLVDMALGVLLSTAMSFRVMKTNAKGMLPGSRITAVERAEYLGQLVGETPMDITISLKVHNQADLEQFLVDVQDPASPVYHRYLTMEQFVDRYSPRAGDYARVLEFLRHNGFTITDAWENRLTVGARASARAVENAFGVTMNRYRFEGREAYAAAETPSIPAALADAVDGIIGLDTMYRYHTNSIRGEKVNKRTFQTASNGKPPYGPPEFQSIYQLTVHAGVNDGTGQHVAVILWHSNINKTDLQNFWATWGIAQSINNVKVIGVGASPPAFSESGEDAELALDTQYSSSFTAVSTALASQGMPVDKAPRSTGPRVTCYIAKDAYPNSTLKAGQKFVVDGKTPTGPKVASLSFGIGELINSISNAEKAVFQNAAAMGLTVCASSGDDGSQGGAPWGDKTPQPSWPASSPYVTAVGGTALFTQLSGGNPVWKNETVWKTKNGFRPSGSSTGGGLSTIFTKPSWQTGLGVPGSNNRCVPDVSLDADPKTGYYVVFGGSAYFFGGTSASSPAIASFFAGINEQRKAAGKSYLGFVNPALYSIFSTSAASAYHDIKVGNNVKYKATPGYDLCTGVGTIHADALASLLVAK